MPKPANQPLHAVEGTSKFSLCSDGATIHLGGKHDPDDLFLPEIYAEKWNGQAWLRLRHSDARRSQGQKAEMTTVERRTRRCGDSSRGEPRPTAAACWRVGGRVHRFYSGSVEHEIVYATRDDVPVDGIETYDVDFPDDGLQWYFQPSLTAEEIADGCIREEDIVGSYAVYGPKAGNLIGPDGAPLAEYETGKFCHVYPWRLIDALEQTASVPITYDPTTKTLRGQLPLDFVSSANYPLTLDPTFGYGSAGGSSYTMHAKCAAVTKSSLVYAANAGDVLTKLWAYAYSDNGGNCDIAAYTCTGPGITVNARGPVVGLTLGASAAWVSGALSQSLVNAEIYTVASGAYSDPVEYGYLKYDTGSSGDGCTRAVGSLQDPFGAQTSDSRRYSMYAEYSAAATRFRRGLSVRVGSRGVI